MSIRSCWPWLCPTWKWKARTSLSGACLAAAPTNCDRWLAARARGQGSSPGIDGTMIGKFGKYWSTRNRNARSGNAQARRSGTLHLAEAQSNRARRGRARGFRRCRRLMKQLVARELTLSFVPDAEQRLWRTVTRRKQQLTRDHVHPQNQWESLLEEAHIKLSSLVSDRLGASVRRMLKALPE